MEKKFIKQQTSIEMTVTSPKNWEKYVNTGDNNFLNDVDIWSAPKRTHAILATEGMDREIILE